MEEKKKNKKNILKILFNLLESSKTLKFLDKFFQNHIQEVFEAF